MTTETMIDSAAREELAQQLRDMLAGEADLELTTPRQRTSGDPAVREIGGQLAILLQELRSANLGHHSRNEIGKSDRLDIARWILFLESELPYRWPSLPRWARIAGIVPSFLTFGLFWYPYRRWFESRGNSRIWPFLTSLDYERARSRRKKERRIGRESGEV